MCEMPWRRKREYVMTSLCYERTFRVQSGKRCVCGCHPLIDLLCCCFANDLSLSIYRTVLRKCWSSGCPVMCVQVCIGKDGIPLIWQKCVFFAWCIKGDISTKCSVFGLFMSSGSKSCFVRHHTSFAAFWKKNNSLNASDIHVANCWEEKGSTWSLHNRGCRLWFSSQLFHKKGFHFSLKSSTCVYNLNPSLSF